MRFIKWLKRDGYFSPTKVAAPNESSSHSPPVGHKLSRNESYLKALTKFYKWRQFHLSGATTDTRQSHNVISSDIEYEEVKLDVHCIFNGCPILRGSRYQAATSTVIGSNDYAPLNVHNNFEVMDNDGPEYAQPFGELTHDTENWEHWKETKIITDLDITQSSVGYHLDRSADIAKSRLCNSELLICSHADIQQYASCTRMNGYLGQGQVDFIELSFINNGDHSAMWNNYFALRKLRHPNIVCLMGVSLNNCGALETLLLEPLRFSLYESIHWQRNIIPTKLCLDFTMQLTNAVIYIHKRQIVHTNISSLCVLVCLDNSTVKLAGFEQSIAPKRANDEIHSAASELAQFKTDVYGLCIVLWETLNCVVPQFHLPQNAMLPMYDTDRCSPFKLVFQRGFQLDSAVGLKLQLQQVDLTVKSTSRRKKTKTKKTVPDSGNASDDADAFTPKKKFNIRIRIASNRSRRNCAFNQFPLRD